jgi:hypothetical protein
MRTTIALTAIALLAASTMAHSSGLRAEYFQKFGTDDGLDDCMAIIGDYRNDYGKCLSTSFVVSVCLTTKDAAKARGKPCADVVIRGPADAKPVDALKACETFRVQTMKRGAVAGPCRTEGEHP